MKADPWIGGDPDDLRRRIEASLEERLRAALSAFEEELDRLRVLPSVRADAPQRVENHAGFLRQLERLRARMSGTSLREEVERLLRDQAAFQASARAVGVVDELLGALAEGL